MPSKGASPNVPGKVTPGMVEQAIYDYVYDTFGKSEAEDPSWYTPDLSRYVANAINCGEYVSRHKVKYVN